MCLIQNRTGGQPAPGEADQQNCTSVFSNLCDNECNEVRVSITSAKIFTHFHTLLPVKSKTFT